MQQPISDRVELQKCLITDCTYIKTQCRVKISTVQFVIDHIRHPKMNLFLIVIFCVSQVLAAPSPPQGVFEYSYVQHLDSVPHDSYGPPHEEYGVPPPAAALPPTTTEQ